MYCQETLFCACSKKYGIMLISFSGNTIRADDVAEGVLTSTENNEDASTCDINTEV